MLTPEHCYSRQVALAQLRDELRIAARPGASDDFTLYGSIRLLMDR